MRLKPGTLVVLEGLEKAGKSSQMELLVPHFVDDHFIHSPSGDGSPIGTWVYEYTEAVKQIHPVARQYMHLAAAADFYERKVVPWLGREGVFMDRCWWSTLAYGWYGGLKHLISYESFLDAVLLPTQGIMPAVVFLFTTPYREDRLNTPGLLSAYMEIANAYAGETVLMYEGTKGENTTQIINELFKRKLAIEE